MDWFSLKPTVENAFLALPLAMTPVLQILLPIALLARHQPRCEHFGVRAAFCIVALLLYGLVGTVASYSASMRTDLGVIRFGTNFYSYSLLALLSAVAIKACFETSFLNALSCASAGYALQNLASGLSQLVVMLQRMAGFPPFGIVAEMLLSDVMLAAVIALAYRPFIKQVEHAPRLDESSRMLVGIFAITILAVISFDVAIRGMGAEGVAYSFLVTLRIVHATVCAFVLWADYELLYNARLRQEVAMAEQLSAERARQYELSRETIAAVNRRVHDIRHQVLRELDGASVDRETLAEVARDIDVYGAQVRTGHDALDTILTEKALLCQREGITLSCIADGSALMWMDAVDLYALFGDVLDAVLEEVRALEDAESRSISLTLRRSGSLALLHVECFAASGQGSDMRIAQARALSEGLGGSLATSLRGAVRSVDVMLPAER